MENGFCGFAMAGCRVVFENAFFEFAWSLPHWFDSCRTMRLKCLTSSIYIQSVSVEERSHLADYIFHTYHCRFFPGCFRILKSKHIFCGFAAKLPKQTWILYYPTCQKQSILCCKSFLAFLPHPHTHTPVVEKLVVTFVNDNWAFKILGRKYRIFRHKHCTAL